MTLSLLFYLQTNWTSLSLVVWIHSDCHHWKISLFYWHWIDLAQRFYRWKCFTLAPQNLSKKIKLSSYLSLAHCAVMLKIITRDFFSQSMQSWSLVELLLLLLLLLCCYCCSQLVIVEIISGICSIFYSLYWSYLKFEYSGDFFV